MTCQLPLLGHPLRLRHARAEEHRYLQLVGAAQLDFMVRTKLIFPLLRQGIRFVNASQLIKFTRPVAVFSRVRVDTAILYADEKCAYFCHALLLQGRQRAEVLVKMKFKQGALTVVPAEIVRGLPSVKRAYSAPGIRLLRACRPRKVKHQKCRCSQIQNADRRWIIGLPAPVPTGLKLPTH
jgi:acyl-CoA thioesterase FadM